ncbi:MAG: aminodeoxychorismate synthase component I [Deltaproteobacteria bacterium]|nr:aminodeoxychorismate synthase component I [Deltaproteobacteria bacterium]
MYSYLFESPHRISLEALLFKIFNEEKSFYLKKGDEGYSYFGMNPSYFFDSCHEKKPLESLNMILSEYIRQEKKSLSYSSYDSLLRGGLVGYLSYDLGKHIYGISSCSKDDLNMPLYALGVYEALFIYEHATNKVFISYQNKKDLKKSLDWLKIPYDKKFFEVEEHPIKLHSCLPQEKYFSSIQKVKDYLYNGETYQVNFAYRLSFNAPRSTLIKLMPQLVYEPHSAFLNFNLFTIVSFSPERFLKLDLQGNIITQPIKGTTPRGVTLREDLRQMQRLEESEKDRAEHVMIVDLERNDLGRISQAGSVSVPEFMKVYSFEKVHHLVSTVKGRIKENIKIMEVLMSTFPGGSITGAPKKRAMHIIEELEPVSRGIYTGSIGYFDFRGNLDLNIAIRTLVTKEDQHYFHVGGGIVIDSDPFEEYEETLVKAKMIVDNL